MAHLAKLGGLTDELVSIITSVTAKSDHARFNVYRESALRSLRSQNHPRTNQFDVAIRLEGLEEKFRIYNEDPLADALNARVKNIYKLNIKWTPEILQLLLELSGRPVVNSRIEDLDYLKEPEPDPGPPLQWKDLVAEDPLLRDKQVWRNIDFGAESSDEDGNLEDSHSEFSGLTELTGQSSVNDDCFKRPEDFLLDSPNDDELQNLRGAQFWLKIPSVGGVKLETVKKGITELQAVREVLFMLSGLPTSLFESLGNSTIIKPSKAYALKHCSTDAFSAVIASFAEQGSAVSSIRSWTNRAQSIPLLQAFQSSISKRLQAFDNLLTRIQQRFVEPVNDEVASLLQIRPEVASQLRQLIRLSDITNRIDEDNYAHAFRYLEMLYDEVCISQMGGDDEMYVFMAEIFFDCFQIYLRPLRTWMEQGELRTGDTVFFVSESSGDIVPASLWRSRFKLRMTQYGILHAPKFLQAAANRIFTTGKSVVVLKHLNHFRPLRPSVIAVEPRLDYESVCERSELQFAPFAELFNEAFDRWVQSKHHHTSHLLRQNLYDSCGLQKSLDALSHIYFMDDGSTAALFANSVFDKLDTLDSSWSDQFTLTELAQGTLGSLPSVQPDSLRTPVTPLPRKYQDVIRCRRSCKTLSAIQFKYQLSWPIQIVLTPDTMPSYQRICTFLLQIRRSSHILSRQRLVIDILRSTSSSDERALYYSIRLRLIWFSQTLYYYLTSLVIEPNSHKMRAALKEAVDVDAMIAVHTNYMKSIIDQALLSNSLQVIHKTILSILDLSIKLQDAQAANALANKEAFDQQQEMMDLSIASLGLHTPQRKSRALLTRKRKAYNKHDDSSSDEHDLDIDVSLLSSTYESPGENVSYVQRLRTMKADFDRLVRFLVSGLKGVARAGAGEDSRSWDTFGEMLEVGLGKAAQGFQGY